MWAVFPSTPRLCTLPLTISATSQPARPRSKPPGNNAVTTKDIKGLGHTILTALNSSHPSTNPDPTSGQHKQGIHENPRGKQEDEGRQISGSDVLWALERAAAQKGSMTGSKKMKKQKRLSLSVSGRKGENSTDYSKAKPLRIKSEWGVRLNEFEKRLRQASEAP